LSIEFQATTPPNSISSITDNAANPLTYNIDVQDTTANINGAIVSADCPFGFPSGSVVTVNFAALGVNKNISADYVVGLVAGVGAFDKSADTETTSTTSNRFTSGATATTTQSDELWWGVAGIKAAEAAGTWWDVPFSQYKLVGSTHYMAVGYWISTVSAAVTASGTYATQGRNFGIVATYRAYLARPPEPVVVSQAVKLSAVI